MLDLKKWMAKVTDYLRKSLIGSVSNVYWWNNTWTAPSDGMMVIRITPNNNSSWYWYVNDTSINATTGSWAHQFRGADNNTVTHCIPVKKGATYSTAAVSNLNTIYCFFYPLKIGGVLLNSIFKAFTPILVRGWAVC